MEHATISDTLPDTSGLGGCWLVSCPCGWSESGRYGTRTLPYAEAIALGVAHAYGDLHELKNGDTQ